MTRPFRASVEATLPLPDGAWIVSWKQRGNPLGGKSHIVHHGRDALCGRAVPWDSGEVSRDFYAWPPHYVASEVCVWCLRKLKRNGEGEK